MPYIVRYNDEDNMVENEWSYDDLDEAVGHVAVFAVFEDDDDWNSDDLRGIDIDGAEWSIWTESPNEVVSEWIT